MDVVVVAGIFGISNGPWLTNIQQALDTLDTKHTSHTISFRQSRCAFPTPAFTLWNPISYVLDNFTNRYSSQRETDRRATSFLLSPSTNGLRLARWREKWYFYVDFCKKEIKERKNSTNGRKNGLWSQAQRTNKSILYGCNLDTLPLTKKASATCTDNTSDNSWFMIRSYTPSNFRDTLNFYNVLKSITAFRDTSDHTRTIRTLLCR